MKNHYSCSAFGFRAGLIVAGTLLLAACAPGQDNPTPATTINVTRYVAVGDSYTAGVSAGGLTRASQSYSFPNLLAQQLSRAAASVTFSQPLLEEGSGSGYLTFIDFVPGTDLPRVRRVAGQSVLRTYANSSSCASPDTMVLARSTTSATLPQNLGVAGLALGQLEVTGLGNAANAIPGAPFNPYFERLLPAADNRTYLQAVTTASSSATFFTFFMGLDDLMPFIKSGGTCGTPPTTSFVNQMKRNARKVLDVLTAGGRPGIIAKLPDATSLPLLRLGAGTVLEAQLQTRFGDQNLLYIEDNGGTVRQISPKDYVLATALPRIGLLTRVQVGSTSLMLPYGRDIRNPIVNADVLDETTEMNLLNAAISSYNNFDNPSSSSVLPGLNALAKLYNMPVLTSSTGERTLNLNDLLFNSLADGTSNSGVVYNLLPVRGNFFSLDYYSLTPRGNAQLANAFIGAINRGYRANIPGIDANSLPPTAQ
ncbi:MAG: hypothetical protein M3Y54_16740 [Bacteroidota bacterium]|nr:hypothetical protein [Bacteroidota bacterium]